MNEFFILIAIIFIIYILYIIRRENFSIKESMFWVLGTIAILVFAICPKVLDKMALKLHIAYPPSLLFLMGIMFLLFINFRSTIKISKQSDKIIELAQRCSIMEFEIDKIKKGEEDVKHKANKE